MKKKCGFTNLISLYFDIVKPNPSTFHSQTVQIKTPQIKISIVTNSELPQFLFKSYKPSCRFYLLLSQLLESEINSCNS